MSVCSANGIYGVSVLYVAQTGTDTLLQHERKLCRLNIEIKLFSVRLEQENATHESQP